MSNEETVERVLSRALTNVMNYPADVRARLLGADMSKVIEAATKAVMESGAVEKVDVMTDRPSVGRVELIVNSERNRIIYGAYGVATALQDGGETLKIFVRKDL